MDQEPQTARERAILLLRAALVPGWLPRWLPTSGFQRLVWTLRIAIILVIALFIFSAFDKGLWDWLQLLIVPAALTLGVAGLTWAQRQREHEAEEAQQERERKAEENRRERERVALAAQRERELESEDRRAQDAALQAYLDQMSQLLTNKDHPLHSAQQGDSLSTVARARTLTVLTRLDGVRKGSVVQFLYESGLIAADRLVLDLSGANLFRADLGAAFLIGANLSRARLSEADLRGANLAGAKLSETNLSKANLSKASLGGAKLDRANLHRADLSGTNLTGADLTGADLIGAILRGAQLSRATLMANLNEADLSDANLFGANFSEASLRGATGWTEEQLAEAEGLEYSDTMPDGQEYEDWIKTSKGKKYQDLRKQYEDEWKQYEDETR